MWRVEAAWFIYFSFSWIESIFLFLNENYKHEHKKHTHFDMHSTMDFQIIHYNFAFMTAFMV